MSKKTFYRAANVSRKEAIASLYEGFPNADLLSLETKRASETEAETAEVHPGELVYAATIRVSEFPPKEDGGGDPAPPSDDDPSDDGPSDDGPPSPPKAEKSEEGGDDEPSEDKPPAADSAAGAPPDGKPEKMKPEEEMVHILRQILEAVSGGAGLGGPPKPHGAPHGGPPGPPDLGAVEVGAPSHGDLGGPPEGPGGPGAGPSTPLPPPVPQPAKRGPAAFAHYNPEAATVYSVRRGANTIKNLDIVADAAKIYPTHKVAKIQRTGTAVIEGETVNLPEHNLALLTLERKG